MVAAIQYQFTGSEGGAAYIHPMGGHRCLDVIFKGESLEIGPACSVNEETGLVQILLPVARTDEMTVLFVTKPWFIPGGGSGGGSGDGTDFILGPGDFYENEFL